MQVAGQVTPRYSLVGGAYDHDCISFSRPVLQRPDLQITVLAPIGRISDTSRACYKIAREPPACLLCASCNANPNGEIVFREPTSSEVPTYAILSHTWGEEEVVYQDLKKGKDKSTTVSKAGWRKIQFCAKQAAVDGLEYFWVDTCFIDKKNAVE